ncbi:5-methyltetrahydrofolate:corrinoid/iron-sulfur protein co-methyltransferase [subsurface metagenome]
MIASLTSLNPALTRSPEQLFLDPIVMPLKYMQDQAGEILNAAGQFRLFSDPPCHIVCGLSNISNGTTHKKLINRVFAVMLIANGLDAVILDVMDEEMVNSILTAELVMNKSIYADSYIEAFRS